MPRHRREWVLSVDAWNELADILRHSASTWGSRQRTIYQQLFDATLTTLASAPDIGRKREDVATGLRSHPAGHQVISYWTTEEEIEVAHILHERQDPGNQEWS